MINSIRKIVNGLMVLAVLLLPMLSLVPVCQSATGIGAAGGVLNSSVAKTGLSSDLTSMVGMIIQGILGVVGSIFFIMMVYAGVLWLTAKGNDTAIEKAKGIIAESVIGTAVTFGAYAITYFVVKYTGGAK